MQIELQHRSIASLIEAVRVASEVNVSDQPQYVFAGKLRQDLAEDLSQRNAERLAAAVVLHASVKHTLAGPRLDELARHTARYLEQVVQAYTLGGFDEDFAVQQAVEVARQLQFSIVDA